LMMPRACCRCCCALQATEALAAAAEAQEKMEASHQTHAAELQQAVGAAAAATAELDRVTAQHAAAAEAAAAKEAELLEQMEMKVARLTLAQETAEEDRAGMQVCVDDDAARQTSNPRGCFASTPSHCKGWRLSTFLVFPLAIYSRARVVFVLACIF
jgi:hypothetical protein